jgi:chromosome segregation ATPase
MRSQRAAAGDGCADGAGLTPMPAGNPAAWLLRSSSWAMRRHRLYPADLVLLATVQSSPVEPLATSFAELKRSVHTLLESKQQLSQHLVVLRQEQGQIESALQTLRLEHEALASERESLAAVVQQLTDQHLQFQLERDQLSKLNTSQQADLEACARERSELQSERVGLESRLGEEEAITNRMKSALEKLFPDDYYRTLHPDLSQASADELIAHFIDVGQDLDSPTHAQTLLAEVENLGQQREAALAKIAVLETNFEHTTTEIAILKDLFARLVSKAPSPSLPAAP